MNTKCLYWGTAALVAAAGAWFARSAWRAHRNLVTLHVRNEPLAEVIRKIERQTWEKIGVDKKLDALVTLDVRDKPLAVVLDRIAQQTGARWSTVYAVYESKAALRSLEAALHGDKKMEEAGWKTIAPAALASEPTDPNVKDLPGIVRSFVATNSLKPSGSGPGQIIISAGGPAGGGRPIIVDEDIQARDTGGKTAYGKIGATTEETVDETESSQAGSPGARKTRRQQGQGPTVVRIVRKRGEGDNGTVEEEIWSPTELVLESRLSPRLSGDFSLAATPEAADEAARQIKGRWKTYYALRKSQFGMGLSGMPLMVSRFAGERGANEKTLMSGVTNLAQLAGNTNRMAMDIEGAVRNQRLDELGELTPEQRVQRARERQRLQQK